MYLMTVTVKNCLWRILQLSSRRHILQWLIAFLWNLILDLHQTEWEDKDKCYYPRQIRLEYQIIADYYLILSTGKSNTVVFVWLIDKLCSRYNTKCMKYQNKAFMFPISGLLNMLKKSHALYSIWFNLNFNRNQVYDVTQEWV